MIRQQGRQGDFGLVEGKAMNPRVITQLAVATALLLAGAAAAKAEPHNMTPLASAIPQHLAKGWPNHKNSGLPPTISAAGGGCLLPTKGH